MKKQEKYEVTDYTHVERIVASINGDETITVTFDDGEPVNGINSITFLKKGAAAIYGSGVYSNDYLVYRGNFDVQIRRYFYDDCVDTEMFVYGDGQLPLERDKE